MYVAAIFLHRTLQKYFPALNPSTVKRERANIYHLPCFNCCSRFKFKGTFVHKNVVINLPSDIYKTITIIFKGFEVLMCAGSADHPPYMAVLLSLTFHLSCLLLERVPAAPELALFVRA